MDCLGRIERLFGAAELDAYIITSEANMRYFSGFTGDSGALLVGGDTRCLITDSRYREQAQEQAPDYEYVEFSADFPL